MARVLCHRNYCIKLPTPGISHFCWIAESVCPSNPDATLNSDKESKNSLTAAGGERYWTVPLPDAMAGHTAQAREPVGGVAN